MKYIYIILSAAALLGPQAAVAQTVSAKGVSTGSDAISVAVPQVRDLGLTVTEITTQTTQIQACAANGELLADDDGNCTSGASLIDIEFTNFGSANVLYIQNPDSEYLGNNGETSDEERGVHISLDGPSGEVNRVEFSE